MRTPSHQALSVRDRTIKSMRPSRSLERVQAIRLAAPGRPYFPGKATPYKAQTPPSRADMGTTRLVCKVLSAVEIRIRQWESRISSAQGTRILLAQINRSLVLEPIIAPLADIRSLVPVATTKRLPALRLSRAELVMRSLARGRSSARAVAIVSQGNMPLSWGALTILLPAKGPSSVRVSPTWLAENLPSSPAGRTTRRLARVRSSVQGAPREGIPSAGQMHFLGRAMRTLP